MLQFIVIVVALRAAAAAAASTVWSPTGVPYKTAKVSPHHAELLLTVGIEGVGGVKFRTTTWYRSRGPALTAQPDKALQRD